MFIRPYQPTDFPALARWIADARTHALWCANRVPYPLEAARFHAFLAELAQRDGAQPFTAVTEADRPAGFFCISVDPESREGDLRFVVVDSALRGRGLGAELMRLALNRVFEVEDAGAVRLSVFLENPAAVRCYEKAGFNRMHQAANAFPFCGEAWTRLIMVALNPAPRALAVNGVSFAIRRLLGKGKGGYSWLAEREGTEYVLKQLHHEPCDYYQFGDKLAAELGDYDRLRAAGIPVPELIDSDRPRERLLKAYISGPTAADLVRDGGMCPEYLEQVCALSERARAAGLNLDWYPTNFIPRDGVLWYVDYECNPYMEKWSLEAWGMQYWTRE